MTMKSNLSAVLARIEAEKRVRLEQSGVAVQNHVMSRTPVDTGRLRASIHSQVDGDSVRIGTNVNYAVFVELGTRHQSPQPYLVPGLIAAKGDLTAIWGREVS